MWPLNCNLQFSVYIWGRGVNPLVSTVSGHPQFLALWCPRICGHPQNLFSVISEHVCIYCLKCTKFGRSNLWKVTKIVDTSCQIWRLKYTKFDFGWSSAPDPLREYTALPQAPQLDLRGPTFRDMKGEGRERRGSKTGIAGRRGRGIGEE